MTAHLKIGSGLHHTLTLAHVCLEGAGTACDHGGGRQGAPLGAKPDPLERSGPGSKCWGHSLAVDRSHASPHGTPRAWAGRGAA